MFRWFASLYPLHNSKKEIIQLLRCRHNSLIEKNLIFIIDKDKNRTVSQLSVSLLEFLHTYLYSWEFLSLTILLPIPQTVVFRTLFPIIPYFVPAFSFVHLFCFILSIIPHICLSIDLVFKKAKLICIDGVKPKVSDESGWLFG